MSRVYVPSAGHHPLVHVAQLAVSAEENYKVSCESSYERKAARELGLETAAWANALCALMVKLVPFLSDEELEAYKTSVESFKVELALRYQPDEE